MITLLIGENSYGIEHEMRRLIAECHDSPEVFDGAEIDLRQLPDLLMGMNLFAEKRLVVIRSLSVNKPAWDAVPSYLEAINDTTDLLLVETKPDKRTRTFKALQKHATIREFQPWTERETVAAERWVMEEASRIGVMLELSAARLLVQRSIIGSEKGAIIDQWRLLTSLEKLSPLGSVGSDQVAMYIEESTLENVFSLFETALKSDNGRVSQMTQRLEISEDPYKLFGLLAGQVFQLAVLNTSATPSNVVAKEIGAHPYVLSRLAPYAKQLSAGDMKTVVAAFAEADRTMKSSTVAPWLLIERTLLKVAEVVKK